MPVFVPLVFQGLMAAARAALPNVARFFTQATTSAAARTSAASARIGANARAAGPGGAVPFVVGGVAIPTAITYGLGLIPPTTQSGVIPQSLRKPGLPDPDRNLPSGLDTQDGPYSWPIPSQKSNTQTQPQTVAGTTSAPAAPAPAPEPPPPPPPDPPTFQAVKAAPIDTVTFVDEPYDEGFYADILFEDFGGQELLSISRSDTVNGQKVSYQPFKDLGIIRDQYNPSSLLSIQETSDRFFANFLIKLNEKIPNVGNGPNGKNIYFDSSTGDGIIELVNVETEEQVEIQILNAGIIEDIGI